jgi:hypothetical protein
MRAWPATGMNLIGDPHGRQLTRKGQACPPKCVPQWLKKSDDPAPCRSLLRPKEIFALNLTVIYAIENINYLLIHVKPAIASERTVAGLGKS